ncbi:MAG: DUF1800 family protein, partial [Pseudomonadota bacterium]
WKAPLANVKPPFDFVVSALGAAGALLPSVDQISATELRKGLVQQLATMGQPLLRPPGPDGWDNAPESWITPPLLAARIGWAGALAERIAPDHDPRAFLTSTLGDAASEQLTFAVNGAESRTEGIALTLVSPEFNRR